MIIYMGFVNCLFNLFERFFFVFIFFLTFITFMYPKSYMKRVKTFNSLTVLKGLPKGNLILKDGTSGFI